MLNPNHPKTGSQIKVDPIKNLKDIKSIKKLLKDNPRDYALFVMGINTNLRASDLVSITVQQVQDLKPGDDLDISPIFFSIKQIDSCLSIERLLQL